MDFTKVVVNKSYGGFGLSDKGKELYEQLAVLQLTFMAYQDTIVI